MKIDALSASLAAASAMAPLALVSVTVPVPVPMTVQMTMTMLMLMLMLIMMRRHRRTHDPIRNAPNEPALHQISCQDQLQAHRPLWRSTTNGRLLRLKTVFGPLSPDALRADENPEHSETLVRS
jgi:hypothetical protein